ncbi:MAG: RnfABCDGE type electron transport complex subunit G [Spirochaetales bacterium]|nr:RnfABCDGE type electron transport complex subunit G [Spirochaetales bacterium]
MKNLIVPAVVLSVTCVVAAASLALVDTVTKDKIAENERVEKENAMRVVQPRATGFKIVVKDKLWEALDGDTVVGRVLSAESQGYSGVLSIIFGIDLENHVTGIKIVTQTETPGLGAKIIKPSFTDQYRGKPVDQLFLKKDDPAKGKIDAITGATISPRAVTKAVREALDAFLRGELTAAGAAKETTP